jgi:voltage-gated potassium channel
MRARQRARACGGAVYFAFVTGLTIGYGDIVPRQALTRALAMAIGFGGISSPA